MIRSRLRHWLIISFGVTSLLACAGGLGGCKGKGAEGKAPALVKVGTPMVLGGISWEVVEASDRGQVLAATSDAEVLRTQGHFVQVHFLLVNKGSSETGLTAPDLVDYDPDTGKNSLHFRPHADGWEHLPPGAENLDRSKLPPSVPKDFWTIYDVAAGVTQLHVWFAGAAPQIDLGPLAATPAIVATMPPDAGTGDAGSSPLCPDLDTWLKPLMDDAKSLGAVMPALGAKTKGDASFDALRAVYKEMQQQTSTSAATTRARLVALQSNGSTPEEAQILSDLMGAHDVTATGFDRYSGAFRMGRISEALAVQKALLDYPATMTRLDKDLRARCTKVMSGGGAVAAAPAAKPAATSETTYCPNGLFAEGHHGYCACSKYPSLAAAAGHEDEAPGEPINAPRPTHLKCEVGTFPATKGSACIWSCK